MTFKEALTRLNAQQRSKVIIETYFFTLICHDLYNNNVNLSYILVLLFLLRSFVEVCFRHVQRFVNHVTHIMARAICSQFSPRSWTLSPSYFLYL